MPVDPVKRVAEEIEERLNAELRYLRSKQDVLGLYNSMNAADGFSFMGDASDGYAIYGGIHLTDAEVERAVDIAWARVRGA